MKSPDPTQNRKPAIPKRLSLRSVPMPQHMRRSKPSLDNWNTISKGDTSKKKRPMLKSAPKPKHTEQHQPVSGMKISKLDRPTSVAKGPLFRSVPVSTRPPLRSVPMPQRPSLPSLAIPNTKSQCQGMPSRSMSITMAKRTNDTAERPMSVLKLGPAATPDRIGRRSESGIRKATTLPKNPLKTGKRPLLRSVPVSKQVCDRLSHLRSQLKTDATRKQIEDEALHGSKDVGIGEKTVRRNISLDENKKKDKQQHPARHISTSDRERRVKRCPAALNIKGKRQLLPIGPSSERSTASFSSKHPPPKNTRHSEGNGTRNGTRNGRAGSKGSSIPKGLRNLKPRSNQGARLAKARHGGKGKTYAISSDSSSSEESESSGSYFSDSEEIESSESESPAKTRRDREGTGREDRLLRNGAALKTPITANENKKVSANALVRARRPSSGKANARTKYDRGCSEVLQKESKSSMRMRDAAEESGKALEPSQKTTTTSRSPKLQKTERKTNDDAEFFSMSYADQLAAVGQDISAGGCPIKENLSPDEEA